MSCPPRSARGACSAAGGDAPRAVLPVVRWSVRWGALFGLVASTAACLSVYAPRVRARGVHTAVTATSSNASCMGCHEAESEASARLAKMSPHRRQHEMAKMMTGDGEASLVAQWMIDDTRSCASCHAPRWGQP